MRIAVDIDGVLTNETEGWDYAKRTPNKDNIRRVDDLFLAGHKIILFTARRLEDLEATKVWLDHYGVLYNHIIFDKPQYDYIIDDKALSPKEAFGESSPIIS
jgi:uncharacterized HAD superfamily protein